MSDFEKKVLEFKNKLDQTQDVKLVESVRSEIFGKNGFINQEFKLSKVKIILTKCNPPITGFDGKVSIVRILENN